MNERLTVIGSGTMGHSVTLCAAWAGISVNMYGVDEYDSATAMSTIGKKVAVLLANNLINSAEADRILKNIRIYNSIDDSIKDSNFIIECIPEDVDLKNQLFLRLDSKCAPDVVLASNTSGLRLSDIARGTLHPQRILITHFWNPAHLIPLVEVLRTSETTERVFERTMNLLKFMRKKPIEVIKDVPGLVGNRLQFALFREAQHILDTGVATREDIDAAVTFGLGRRLTVTGPFLSADMGGLDVFDSVSSHLFKDLSIADESYEALKSLVSQEKFGDKSGEGYYQWTENFSAEMNAQRENFLIHLIKKDRLKEPVNESSGNNFK